MGVAMMTVLPVLSALTKALARAPDAAFVVRFLPTVFGLWGYCRVQEVG